MHLPENVDWSDFADRYSEITGIFDPKIVSAVQWNATACTDYWVFGAAGASSCDVHSDFNQLTEDMAQKIRDTFRDLLIAI